MQVLDFRREFRHHFRSDDGDENGKQYCESGGFPQIEVVNAALTETRNNRQNYQAENVVNHRRAQNYPRSFFSEQSHRA